MSEPPTGGGASTQIIDVDDYVIPKNERVASCIRTTQIIDLDDFNFTPAKHEANASSNSTQQIVDLEDFTLTTNQTGASSSSMKIIDLEDFTRTTNQTGASSSSAQIVDLEVSTPTSNKENATGSSSTQIIDLDSPDVLIEEKYRIFKHTLVEKIIYAHEPIEYPPTSENGIAILYDINGWKTTTAAFSNIQYPIGNPGGGGGFLLFFKCSSNKKLSNLQGGEDMTHSSVDPEEADFMNIARTTVSSKGSSIDCKTKEYTNQQGHKCTGGHMVFRKFSQPMVLAGGAAPLNKFCLGCSMWQPNQKHLVVVIPDHYNLEYLRRLVEGDEIVNEPESQRDPTDPCATVLLASSRQKFCFELHKLDGDWEQGAVQPKTCNVKFIKVTPLDLVACPYVMVICIGTHSHPPPPPLTIPFNIRQEIEEHLAVTESGTLQPRQIFGRKFLQTWFSRGMQTIAAEFHPSLNQLSSVRRLVSAERRRRDPWGESVVGVMAELYKRQMQRDDPDACYIRKADFTSNNNLIVICGTKKQVEALQSSEEILVDMTFKGIRSMSGKLLLETPTLISIPQETGRGLRFSHIHGDEEPAISVIMADLDGGQYKGLGLFLEKLTAETTKMTWSEHLLHIFKSCVVHFKRNVLKNAAGEARICTFSNPAWCILRAGEARICTFSNPAWCILRAGEARKSLRALIESICTYTDPDTIDLLFDEIINIGAESGLNLEDWAELYKQPYIIGSLNPVFSKIPLAIWTRTSNQSNAIESLHANTNRDLKNASLLHCIRSRHNYDVRRWRQLEFGDRTGVYYKDRVTGSMSTLARPAKPKAPAKAPAQPKAPAKPRATTTRSKKGKEVVREESMPTSSAASSSSAPPTSDVSSKDVELETAREKTRSLEREFLIEEELEKHRVMEEKLAAIKARNKNARK
ncbi:hypothetical protein DFS34DRAFT_590445 [Phlyctochytrium arcticum]|nr:hypothetical protein DFS34DRAFT_590445 [Phlyctochytrium arcticum]